MSVGRSGVVPARNQRFRRVSGAHVVVVLAGLLGGVLTLAAVRADAHEVRVLVATRDLQVGARLRAGDVREVAIRGDASVLPSVLRGGESAAIGGDVPVAPVRRGDPLRRSDLALPATSAGARSVSFAVD